MEEQHEIITCTPPELREIANSTVGNLLPQKSKLKYEKEYLKFDQWCKENKAQHISENVLLAYFELQTHLKKPSSLWSMYSMLRSYLNVHKNVDISRYVKLQALLKRFSQGYEPKKSKILDLEQINRFIQEADDKHYLDTKPTAVVTWSPLNDMAGGSPPQLPKDKYIETSVQRKVEVAGTLAQASKSSSSLHGILAQGCTSTHVESAVPSAIIEGNINRAEHNIVTHNLPGIKVNTHDGAVTVKVYNNCTFNYADKDEI
ncbi:hypothetical protein PPYR_04331 [Photinus pyralis]|uniref:Uncharacterized protein n=1 Tax=Photinus pyralis TaxID=7054 RepID=A0A5N4AXQ5_PHOPY|nr:hypothetical protein PPYR_04331 [Photinus pyralis]